VAKSLLVVADFFLTYKAFEGAILLGLMMDFVFLDFYERAILLEHDM
jgi:hypothetical protein